MPDSMYTFMINNETNRICERNEVIFFKKKLFTLLITRGDLSTRKVRKAYD